jgi:predicted Zn-ribbon and HTH transcriptional regulator
MRPQDVEDDLAHLLRSLRHTGYRAVIEPARCRHCGFQFGKNKLHKPGKCPKCRQTWIADPLVRIEGSGE